MTDLNRVENQLIRNLKKSGFNIHKCKNKSEIAIMLTKFIKTGITKKQIDAVSQIVFKNYTILTSEKTIKKTNQLTRRDKKIIYSHSKITNIKTEGIYLQRARGKYKLMIRDKKGHIRGWVYTIGE